MVTTSSVGYTAIEHGQRLGPDATTRALAAGYRPTLLALRRVVPRVAVLVDTPRPPWDVPDCVSKRLHELQRCAFRRRLAVLRARAVAAGGEHVRGVRVIDATDEFCLRELCPAVIGDVLVYRQTGHITATYAVTLAPWLDAALS